VQKEPGALNGFGPRLTAGVRNDIEWAMTQIVLKIVLISDQPQPHE
jgi:hypothetical protein